MANRQAFGRRGGQQPQRWPVRRDPPAAAQAPSFAPSNKATRVSLPAEPVRAAEAVRTPSVDAELEEWKRARRKNFKIPWRPLYIMASICFGIASFVLPDSVNSNVDYLLYALMAASFYAGIKKRREKKAAAS